MDTRTTKFGHSGFPRLAQRVAVAAAFSALIGLNSQLLAATLCVNASGTNGCYRSIHAAVSAANAGDTINVSRGVYREDVVVDRPLALVGADADSTIIDAKGLANGVFVDGIGNTGLGQVVITGFTVRNANFEGILVASATDVTIAGNVITQNDKGLVLSSSGPPSCPGIPAFETGEAFDCGEGMHLMGVDHSVVSGNIVVNNAGGMLISDETAATHDNVIRDNLVKDNSLDCGITLASHSPAGGGPVSFGVFRNTISGNDSEQNGLADGGGGGVGIFAGGPGNKAYANVIIHNRLIGNGLPGVTMHNHFSLAALPADLNDNVIVDNYIAGNHADTADAATPGATGINVFGFGAVTGTVIAQNTIRDEAYDVVTNTAGSVSIHLNDLAGAVVGVDNIGAGTVDATENWWGCGTGPGSEDCSSAEGPGVDFAPWLRTHGRPDDGSHGH